MSDMSKRKSSNCIFKFLFVALLLTISISAYGADVYITGVTPVDDIDVPYGTSIEDATAALPATTTITVSDGSSLEVSLDWTIYDYFPTGRGPNAARGYCLSRCSGGHAWPGKYQYASVMAIGRASTHIDGTEVIWQHIKNHSIPMEISIDITEKAINPRKKGLVAVVVPSTSELDASTIEIDTLRFGPGEARPEKHLINGKGTLILHFRMQDTGINAGDTFASLTGRSTNFGAFYGTDSFKTVPR